MRGVTLGYAGRDSLALKQVDLDWSEGESLWIVGPSGSGKSSLARVLKGLVKPTSGVVSVAENGRETSQREVDLLTQVGWVDAQPERQIFAGTVAEEVGFGPGIGGLTGEELKKCVEDALRMAGMEPGRFLDRDPLTLSGGEKRRLAIASTLAIKTSFYIFDEPGAGLDESGLQAVRQLLSELHRQGAGVMVISHDLLERDQAGASMSDSGKLIVMLAGKIIYTAPLHKIDLFKLNHWLATMEGEPQ